MGLVVLGFREGRALVLMEKKGGQGTLDIYIGGLLAVGMVMRSERRGRIGDIQDAGLQGVPLRRNNRSTSVWRTANNRNLGTYEKAHELTSEA